MAGNAKPPKPKFCVGKDAFERMNYLYQLSNMCATNQINNAETAARLYAHQVIAISKKTVQRISPPIKRKICKICHQYLVPGKTCQIRIRKKVIIHKCLLCHSKKQFPAKPDYVLWNEKPDAIAELLDYRNSEAEGNNKPKHCNVKEERDVKIESKNQYSSLK